MNNRSRAAVRAHVTRRARKTFRKAYPSTCYIAQDLLTGFDTVEVAVVHNVNVSTVAAVQANLNRDGKFGTMAVRCNF